jgi:hypothetical protein
MINKLTMSRYQSINQSINQQINQPTSFWQDAALTLMVMTSNSKLPV